MKINLWIIVSGVVVVIAVVGARGLKHMEDFGRTVGQLIMEGKLGYGILMGRKPVI